MRRAACAIVVGLVLHARAAAAASCFLDATAPVAFDKYDVFAGADLDFAGSVTLRCLLSLSVTIDIGPGYGSYNARSMKHTTLVGPTLNYNVYVDAARTKIWGNASSGNFHFGPTLALVASVVIPIYGRIPARQDATAGDYADTLVITLNY